MIFKRIVLFHICYCISKRSKINDNSATIVTAFFPFSKSKHSLNEYKQWIENLLNYTENPMVVYTSSRMLWFIQRRRNDPIPSELCTKLVNSSQRHKIEDGPLLANLVDVSNSFESACLSTNLSSVIVPLIDVCTLWVHFFLYFSVCNSN